MTETPSRVARPIDTMSDELDAVFDLYRRNSATLGWLPRGAFDEFAREGRILVTMADGALDGYLAYRVAGTDAVIVHLCVREERRGRGVADVLLEELFQQAAGLGSIRLACREEYAANRLWPRHQFNCVSERPGRGADDGRLFIWSRKLAGEALPLLAAIRDAERKGRKTVVIDANVFFDLDGDGIHAEESKSILADWLEPDVLVVVTAELLNEITRQPDRAKRGRARGRLSSFHVLEGKPDDVAEVLRKLNEVLPPATSASDESDRRQLARAAAEQADCFVTRDSHLLDHADAIETVTQVAVFRPVDFVVHLHERSSREQYTPARLVGTTIKRRRPRTESELAPFQRYKQAESKGSWLSVARQVLADPVRFDTFLVEPPGDGPKLLIALDTEGGPALSIRILRGLSHPLTPTLLRRVLSEILLQAQEEGQSLIVCEDVGDPLVEGALSDLGFTPSDACYVKGSIGDVVPVDDVTESLKALFPSEQGLPVEAEPGELERHFWPLKVIGAEIPTYVVSIQPWWASQLFDARLAEEDLFGAEHKIALALENVYYSASRIDIPPGARILWYVSGKGPEKVSQIRACSICQETVTGPASALFRRFARLGIYRWRDLVSTAGGDLERELRAYRFALTERFQQPIPWGRFQAVLQEHIGHGNQCTGPFKVPEGVFQDLYTAGTELVSEHAAVVVSIKPEFTQAIATGRKTVELRRKFPTVAPGMWLVVYATHPVGAVVGIASIKGVDRRPPSDLWEVHQDSAGVTKPFFDEYFHGCDEGHAVELGEWRPLEPTSVAKMNTILPGFRPPQSYRYLGPRTLRRLLRVASNGGDDSNR